MSRLAALCTPDRVLVYPPVTALLAFLAWSVSVFVLGKGILDASGNLVGNDFVGFYTGACLWQQGAEIYSLRAQDAFQQSLVQNRQFTPFINPPIAVLLYLPFSQSGYWPGLLGWWAFNLACLAAGLELLRRSLAPQRAWYWLWFVQWGFFPTLMWWFYGQASAVVFLIWAATLVLLRSGREFWAGLALSCLVFKPQLALPLVFPLVIKGRIRALAGGAVGLLGWGLASAWWFGPELQQFLKFGPSLFEILRLESYRRYGVHSIYGFSNLLVYTSSPALADALTALATLALLIWLAVAVWGATPYEPRTPAWDRAMAVTLAALLLAGFHLYVYDLMLLTIPLWLVACLPSIQARSQQGYLGGGPLLGWTAAAYIACMVSTPLSQAQQKLTTFLGLPECAIQISLLAILGWVLAVWAARREDPSAAVSSPI